MSRTLGDLGIHTQEQKKETAEIEGPRRGNFRRVHIGQGASLRIGCTLHLPILKGAPFKNRKV